MKKARRWLLCVTLSGCGFLGGGPPEIGAEVSLTEPWAELALPVASGRVTMSEPESFIARYDRDDVEGVLSQYGEALATRGWQMQADTSVPGVVNQTWTRDEVTMALSGLSREGEVKVSLSILPF